MRSPHTRNARTWLPHIVRQLQHDVPVPPLDAVSVRTWTSDPWPQADQSNRRWTEADSPAMPIVSVTLGDRCVSGRTRADPPICAGAGSDAVRVSDRRIWVFCALGAGSCARCVYEERDPVLEVLLTCRVYYRDFQPVAADTEIGR
jgi:hypothetical protein